MVKVTSHTTRNALFPIRNFPHVRFNAIAVDGVDLTDIRGISTALEVICSSGCKVPETCFHVRAALAHGADVPALAQMTQLMPQKSARVRVRVPLANRLWTVAVVVAEHYTHFGRPTVYGVHFEGPIEYLPPVPFDLDGRGIDDLKWTLVNLVARRVDEWVARNTGEPHCYLCDQPLSTDINAEPDFAWVVAWASATHHYVCYNCVRKQASAWYSRRATTSDVSSMSPLNKDW